MASDNSSSNEVTYKEFLKNAKGPIEILEPSITNLTAIEGSSNEEKLAVSYNVKNPFRELEAQIALYIELNRKDNLMKK